MAPRARTSPPLPHGLPSKQHPCIGVHRSCRVALLQSPGVATSRRGLQRRLDAPPPPPLSSWSRALGVFLLVVLPGHHKTTETLR